MTNKFSDFIIDTLNNTKAGRAASRLWGATNLIAMGDGVKLRVTKSKFVDYVYIRYLSGFDQFEVEFGALVGTEYDLLDRVGPVAMNDLTKTITQRVFGISILENEAVSKTSNVVNIADYKRVECAHNQNVVAA